MHAKLILPGGRGVDCRSKREKKDALNRLLTMSSIRITSNYMGPIRCCPNYHLYGVGVAHRFPIEKVEEIFKIEKDILLRRDDYIRIISAVVRPSGIVKAFPRLFGDQIAYKFNYDGRKDKYSFRNLVNMNELIFSCLQCYDYLEHDYVKDMKAAFRKAKNRYFKNKCLQKKSIREQMENQKNLLSLESNSNEPAVNVQIANEPIVNE